MEITLTKKELEVLCKALNAVYSTNNDEEEIRKILLSEFVDYVKGEK